VAWSGSAIFREFVAGPMFQASGTGWTGLDSDTINLANYGTTPTPDKDATVANTGYNTGQWVTGNEIVDATNWPAKGLALASKAVTTPSTGVIMFDAADRAGSGNVTLSGVFGGLVLDDTISGGTVADQGVCYLYYGGSQSVTAGTFTVVFAANGVMRITV
jgi:hypothetical protein